MHRWLTWLFRRRGEAEVDPAPELGSASAEAPAAVAVAEGPAPVVFAEAPVSLEAEEVEEGLLPAAEGSASIAVAEGSLEAATAGAPVRFAIPIRETCPVCGRTGVFAGPPGHRYCMRCALREEL